jgi:hypothetical protein
MTKMGWLWALLVIIGNDQVSATSNLLRLLSKKCKRRNGRKSRVFISSS